MCPSLSPTRRADAEALEDADVRRLVTIIASHPDGRSGKWVRVTLPGMQRKSLPERAARMGLADTLVTDSGLIMRLTADGISAATELP
jgi:hypothetical protein